MLSFWFSVFASLLAFFFGLIASYNWYLHERNIVILRTHPSLHVRRMPEAGHIISTVPGRYPGLHHRQRMTMSTRTGVRRHNIPVGNAVLLHQTRNMNNGSPRCVHIHNHPPVMQRPIIQHMGTNSSVGAHRSDIQTNPCINGNPAVGFTSNNPAGGFTSNNQAGGFTSNNPAGGFISNNPAGGFISNNPAGGFTNNSPADSFRNISPSGGYVNASPVACYGNNNPVSCFRPAREPNHVHGEHRFTRCMPESQRLISLGCSPTSTLCSEDMHHMQAMYDGSLMCHPRHTGLPHHSPYLMYPQHNPRYFGSKPRMYTNCGGTPMPVYNMSDDDSKIDDDARSEERSRSRNLARSKMDEDYTKSKRVYKGDKRKLSDRNKSEDSKKKKDETKKDDETQTKKDDETKKDDDTNTSD